MLQARSRFCCCHRNCPVGVSRGHGEGDGDGDGDGMLLVLTLDWDMIERERECSKLGRTSSLTNQI